MSDAHIDVSPLSAGLRGRCPVCGEGALFDGFLTFANHCEACEFDYSSADAGDGPAFFVMSAALFTVVPFAVAVQLATNMPIWLLLLIFVPIIGIFCLALLRPFKGAMFGLQVKHKAAEGRLDLDNKP